MSVMMVKRRVDELSGRDTTLMKETSVVAMTPEPVRERAHTSR